MEVRAVRGRFHALGRFVIGTDYNRCTWVEGEYCWGQASKGGRQLKHMEGLGAIGKKNK
jgi:hypothetical protein